MVIAAGYRAVPDEQYVPGRGAGARIGVAAIREAIVCALTSGLGVFHVHLHDHAGIPSFSMTDRVEQTRLVQSLHAAQPTQPHGMIVVSADGANAWIWMPGETTPSVPARLALVGYPMRLQLGESLRMGGSAHQASETTDRYSRQSFLGPASEAQFASVRIGLLGFGGGGSHVGQQIAHLGVENIRVADGDRIDESNLNRLVGATADDVDARRIKVEIASRIASAVNRSVNIMTHEGPWQQRAELFRSSDIIVGCVDSFAQRQEAEVLARRFAIPYIDIGMDVHQVGDDPPRIGGQLILSMPGGPCMTCLGFLTPDKLAREAARYGAAGGRPQVVWSNGVLASSAVGVIVDLVTAWTRTQDRIVYLSYDGNRGTLTDHVRLQHLGWRACPHFPE
ncbi:MAG: HesA/MoeB/ThiF family protein, partial [Gemmatimonadaceae bacterium]